ncbi:hypothetical protein Q4I32_000138 [Leishmania shawi]|uniref:Uncharacterized protein n=1 Tax=Leishmania shawi TaxID=5680 RepID=A0AAW3CDG3_9TRYP
MLSCLFMFRVVRAALDSSLAPLLYACVFSSGLPLCPSSALLCLVVIAASSSKPLLTPTAHPRHAYRKKLMELSNMRSRPRYSPLHQPVSSVRQDTTNTYPHAYAVPSRQTSSADDGHDNTVAAAAPARPSVSGYGKPRMHASKHATYSSDVNHCLSHPMPELAPTAAPAMAMTQPPSHPQQKSKSVVYTVQNSTTATRAHETEYGGVLTICTTTVTRTITERLVASDEDDDNSENGEVRLEEEHNEVSLPSPSC